MVAVNGSCCVYLYSEGFWKPRPVTRQMTENTGECFIARHRTCSPDYNAQTFRDDNSNDREGVGISIIHLAGFGEVLIYTGGEKKNRVRFLRTPCEHLLLQSKLVQCQPWYKTPWYRVRFSQ